MPHAASSVNYQHLTLPWLAALSFLYAGSVKSQENCEFTSDPADASFDFTNKLSHWGDEHIEEFDQPYRVSSISVNSLPIFDEANEREDKQLFRWANAVHINTRTYVIKDQLLFGEGDVVDARRIHESERVLREKKYVADAKIRIVQRCQDKVDVEVVTREVWTLTPEVSVKSTGGNFTSKFSLRDANVFGSGQSIEVGFKNDVERNSYQIHYSNPSVARSRQTFRSHIENNSDGHSYLIQYGLPFYALDSTNSWGGAVQQTEEVLSQYYNGDTVTDVTHKQSTAEAYWGWSTRLVEGRTQRVKLGVRSDQSQYFATTDHPAPAPFPEDEDYSYPYASYEMIEDNFSTAFNINQIYRTEDLHLGKHLEMEVGYAPGKDTRILFAGSYSDALIHGSKFLLQFDSNWKGKWNPDSSDLYDTVIDAGLKYHRGQTDSRSLFIGLAGTYSHHLNSARQIVLGGDNGLRGYDSFYLTGESSLALSIEQRVFTTHHLFQLARVGFAGFIDAGRVFNNDSPDRDKTYSVVGLGLRLAPSKSEGGGIVHVDLAYPINNSEATQFIIELRDTF